MKQIWQILIFSSALLMTNAHAREISTHEVEAGITRAVTFVIVPDENGRVGECRFLAVQDLKPEPHQSEFKPSQRFIHKVCTESLAQGPNWVPERDSSGQIKDVTEICFWSEAIPDNPVCRAELQATFANQLPNGVGYIVVFGLMADVNGKITSCHFAEISELKRDPKQVDFTPHNLSVADACRKLSSVTWTPTPMGQTPKEFFMGCRYMVTIPARAFCDTKFGK